MLVELQFINLLLSSKNVSLLTTKGLSRDFFPHLRNEYDFIFNHYKQYNQIPDVDTFLKVFKTFQVIEVTESVDYLINELFAQRSQDVIVDNYKRVKELLEKGDREGAIKTIEEAANKVTVSKPLEAIDILEDTSRYDDYIDKCNDFMKYYISTGFKELDDILGGWDRQEELAVISARSGVGKSWILLKSITASVNRGLNVGLFSGEMTVNKVGYRFDTLMSGISNGSIMHGNIDVSMRYKDFLANLKESHKGHLYVLTPDRIGSDATVDSLRGFIEKYNLDILFIDQHSLLIDHSRAKTSFEKAANISKDLKILQTIKHIPIISVSQQNRSTVEEGKYAGTENIAGSDRIAQDATIILFLSTSNDVLTMSIGKSRDGGTGKTLKYNVDFNTGRFDFIRDADEEEDQQEEEINNPQSQDFNPMNMIQDVQFESDDLPF